MKPANCLIAICMLLACAITLQAEVQRRITPVQPKKSTSAPEPTKEVDPKANLTEMQDAQGNIVFVDTVTGREWVDSTAIKAPAKMEFPLWHAVTIGVNVFDPMMRCFGQHYGLVDFWGEISLHNRYKPVFELGLGSCHEAPDDMNYTFKVPLSPYFRIGMNYNMLFNSNPRYQILLGVRYGFTRFSFEVEGASQTSDYWNETTDFSIPKTSSTAGFFEFCAGIRVGIWKDISLGWMIKYHTLLHESATGYGKPMYVPGFGKRGSTFAASFSISYTIPLNKSALSAVNTSPEDN